MLLIGLAVVAIMALTASTALAAKGVITEVNPSGKAARGQITEVNPSRVVDGITDVEVIELKSAGDSTSTTSR